MLVMAAKKARLELRAVHAATATRFTATKISLHPATEGKTKQRHQRRTHAAAAAVRELSDI